MKNFLLITTITLSAGSLFAADCATKQSRMQRQNYLHTDSKSMNYEFTITKLNAAQGCIFKLSYPFDDIFQDSNKDYTEGAARPANEDVDPNEWGTLPISLALDPNNQFARGVERLFTADGMTEAPFKLNHNVIRKCYAQVTQYCSSKAKQDVKNCADQKNVCVQEIAKQIRSLVPPSETAVTKPEEKPVVYDATVEKALTCAEGMKTYHTCSYVRGNDIVDGYRLCLKDGEFGELRLVDIAASGKLRKLTVASFEQVEEITDGNFEKHKEVQFRTPMVLIDEEGNRRELTFKQFGVMNKNTKDKEDKSFSHQLSLQNYSRSETLDPKTKHVISSANASIGVGSQNEPGLFKCN